MSTLRTFKEFAPPLLTTHPKYSAGVFMDIAVYPLQSLSDKHLTEFLSSHKSFVIEDIDRLNIPETVETIEKVIEGLGMKCRVYTKGRSAALAAELAVPLVGWAAAAAMGVHNLATWNPDYEIAKNLITGTLTIEYKK